jgi:predicted enzyme related to lactoylglutathione lyase
MPIRYKHTNIVANDWERLVRFYQEVFECEVLAPGRDLAGLELSRGVGLENAQLKGVHLRLPGYAEDGPTLEIYQYAEVSDRGPAAANDRGLTHIAFEVDDVDASYRKALQHGGRKIADITSFEVPNAGIVTFVYVEDPEGNIVEIQRWM